MEEREGRKDSWFLQYSMKINIDIFILIEYIQKSTFGQGRPWGLGYIYVQCTLLQCTLYNVHISIFLYLSKDSLKRIHIYIVTYLYF